MTACFAASEASLAFATCSVSFCSSSLSFWDSLGSSIPLPQLLHTAYTSPSSYQTGATQYGHSLNLFIPTSCRGLCPLHPCQRDLSLWNPFSLPPTARPEPAPRWSRLDSCVAFLVLPGAGLTLPPKSSSLWNPFSLPPTARPEAALRFWSCLLLVSPFFRATARRGVLSGLTVCLVILYASLNS